MAEEAPTPGGNWPFLDQLIREGEQQPAFKTSPRMQAKVLYALADPVKGYWTLGDVQKGHVLARLMAIVPRLASAPNPRAVLESILLLWVSQAPYETISRAVKVTTYEPRDLLPEEDVYPTTGFIGGYLNWCRESDVPLAYYFWSAVAAIGAACRANYFIDRGNDRLTMQHYLVFVGTKATGKSSAMNAAMEVLDTMNRLVWGWDPFWKVEPDWQQTHPYQVRRLPEDTNQETLVRCLAPSRMELPIPDHLKGVTQPQEVFVDSTGVLALDELATFLGRDNWNIAKRVPFLTTINSAPEYRYRTQKGGIITLLNLAVTMVACCTPDWMREAISPLMFGGGFMDRTLLVFRDPLPNLFPTPKPRDPLVAVHLAEQLRKLTCRHTREEMVATPDAERWFNEWYWQQEESMDPQEASVKRRANHLWRLAAVFSLSEDAQPYIRLEDFQAAARVFETEWGWTRQLLEIIEEPAELDHMRYIERVLFQAGAIAPEHMLRSALFSKLRNRKGLSPPTVRAAPLLESLEQAGRIEKVAVQSVGRTAEAYRLTQATAAEMVAKRKGKG
ncbi:MAG: DUF3987 domain-containing protein [Gemmatimonadales bacterium]|nr:MAG: DUF3987 domain-containing protein [Gemmatimonadales bacterium]